MLDVLNELRIDLPADPKKYLVEQIVPFANKFTCPITIRPFPPFIDPLQAIFFVVRDDEKKRLDIFAARCVKIEFPDEPF
jgi:hypothetical protein